MMSGGSETLQAATALAVPRLLWLPNSGVSWSDLVYVYLQAIETGLGEQSNLAAILHIATLAPEAYTQWVEALPEGSAKAYLVEDVSPEQREVFRHAFADVVMSLVHLVMAGDAWAADQGVGA